MEFTELSDEEVDQMEFASSRQRAGKDPYGDLLKAVKDGKKIQVKLEEGKALKNLKWGLSQAAKKEGMKLTIKVLADQSGVVVSMPKAEQPTQGENGEPKAEAPEAGPKPRK